WWDVVARKTFRQWQLLVDEPRKTDRGEAILSRGIRAACFTPDGKTLALSKWWAIEPDTKYPPSIAIVLDLVARKEKWRQDTQSYPSPFAFSPDGKRLAVSWGSAFWLHDAATGRRLTGPQHVLVWGMDYSRDGKTLAVRTSGEIAFWSNEKTPLRKYEVPRHN